MREKKVQVLTFQDRTQAIDNGPSYKRSSVAIRKNPKHSLKRTVTLTVLVLDDQLAATEALLLAAKDIQKMPVTSKDDDGDDTCEE